MWLAVRRLLKIITGHEPTLVYQWDLCDHVKCQLWQVIMRCTFCVCLLVIKTFYEPHRVFVCWHLCDHEMHVWSFVAVCHLYCHEIWNAQHLVISQLTCWSWNLTFDHVLTFVWPCTMFDHVSLTLVWLWNTCLCDHMFFNICVIMTWHACTWAWQFVRYMRLHAYMFIRYMTDNCFVIMTFLMKWMTIVWSWWQLLWLWSMMTTDCELPDNNWGQHAWSMMMCDCETYV